MSDPTRIEIVVRGDPVGQPRARGRSMKQFSAKRGRMIEVAHIYQPTKRSKADGGGLLPIAVWKQRIQFAARPLMPAEPWAGPVRVDVCAFFDRPQYLLKPSSPAGPIRYITKPDRDNLDKAILDTLTKCGLWKDDCQACAGEIEKWYVAKGAVSGVRIIATHLVNEPQLPLQRAGS